MEIALDMQKRIEAYLREVVTLLQGEELHRKQVDQAAQMLREQIYEAIEQRVGDGEVDAELVASVLEEMPSPGEFALEAAQVTDDKSRPTDSSTAERLARSAALILTVVIVAMCMEGAVSVAKPLVGGGPYESEGADSVDESATPSTTTSPKAASQPTETQPADTTPYDEEYDDEVMGTMLFFLGPLLLAGVIVSLLILLVLGAVVVAIFCAGAVMLGCSLAVLNVAISIKRKSWLTFLRLCVWELPIAAGCLGGMFIGAVMWHALDLSTWRISGYIGLSIGATTGLVGAWLAIVLLNWIAGLIVRYKQRHLPILRITTRQKFKALVSRMRGS